MNRINQLPLVPSLSKDLIRDFFRRYQSLNDLFNMTCTVHVRLAFNLAWEIFDQFSARKLCRVI